MKIEFNIEECFSIGTPYLGSCEIEISGEDKIGNEIELTINKKEFIKWLKLINLIKEEGK